MKIISGSAKDTIRIGRKIAKNLERSDIICLFGQLGSGKTVLTKGIAEGLGIEGKRVTSPSFILMRQHSGGKLPLYHLDLYRLNNNEDIVNLGYEEYLYGDGVTVIEWAERLKKLLPAEYLRIELSLKSKSNRLLNLTACGEHYQGLLRAL